MHSKGNHKQKKTIYKLNWEKIFANEVTEKGLISKYANSSYNSIYFKIILNYNLNIKYSILKYIEFKVGNRPKSTFLQSWHTGRPKDTWKDAQHH